MSQKKGQRKDKPEDKAPDEGQDEVTPEADEAEADEAEPDAESAPEATPEPASEPASRSAPSVAAPTESASEAGALRLEGQASGALLPGPVRVLMAVTGVSLVVGLVKLLLRFVLGLRREGRVEINDGKLRLEETTRFAGREIKAEREHFGREAIVSARLETRYPYLPTLLGLAGLGLGVIFGLLWLLDGIQGEFTPWILAGVGALLTGVVLDLGLTALASSMPGKTTVVLRLPGRRVLRLIGCDPSSAEAVVDWLHQRER